MLEKIIFQSVGTICDINYIEQKVFQTKEWWKYSNQKNHGKFPLLNYELKWWVWGKQKKLITNEAEIFKLKIPVWQPNIVYTCTYFETLPAECRKRKSNSFNNWFISCSCLSIKNILFYIMCVWNFYYSHCVLKFSSNFSIFHKILLLTCCSYLLSYKYSWSLNTTKLIM